MTRARQVQREVGSDVGTPIVDSHVHVWSDDPYRYPWRPLHGFKPPTIPGSLELLVRRLDENGVDKAVIVQPTFYGYDHRYVLDCCRRYPDRLAAVCLVDPLDPRAPQQLERMIRKEGVSGLRLAPLLTPSDWRWLNAPTSHGLWQAAAEFAIPIGVVGFPNQMEALEEMVGRFQQVHVIVDHLGRQYVEESPEYPSARHLLRLASYPNTYVKVSAPSASSKERYPYRDAVGLVRRILEHFGAHRLLWGTDFPYVEGNEGYARSLALVNVYDFMSAEEKEWLMGKTALSLFDFNHHRFA